MSQVYRQASAEVPQYLAADPADRYPNAGVLLDEHLVTSARQLMRARRGHRDPVFLILDFPRDAYPHRRRILPRPRHHW